MYDFKTMTDDQIEHMIEWLQRAADRISEEEPDDWSSNKSSFSNDFVVTRPLEGNIKERIFVEHINTLGMKGLNVSYVIIKNDDSRTYYVSVSKIEFIRISTENEVVRRVTVDQSYPHHSGLDPYEMVEMALLDGLMMLKLTWG